MTLIRQHSYSTFPHEERQETYDLSLSSSGSHWSPGSGTGAGAGAGVDAGVGHCWGGPRVSGGAPVDGVLMRLTSWLFGLGGSTGGLEVLPSGAKLAMV